MTNLLNAQIYVANLGKYNEGTMVGEWFDLPISYEEIAPVIGLNAQYEEILICDTDNVPFKVWEYENLESINEKYEALQGLDATEIEAVTEAFENGYFSSYEESIEAMKNGDIILHHDCREMEDVAMEYIDMIGGVSQLSESNKTGYFDTASFIRDLEIEGFFEEFYGSDDIDKEEKENLVYELLEGNGISEENFERYFDYYSFGRDMEIEGSFHYLGSSVYMEVLN